jgi:N-methylhydantoinase A
VPERLDETGNPLEALDEDAVRDVAAAIDDDIEAVAVSLLYAFENDSHERRVADLLADELDAIISRSSAVLPEIREYERTLTTALNAALVPVVDRYLDGLETWTHEHGLAAGVQLMQSNGGLAAAAGARERPVTTLLSGPAAGVRGATAVAERCDIDDCITMDMGGTSCDVSLVADGDPVTSTTTEVGEYPVGVPAVDIHTVGAGGGSIAWLDEGDALRVGPRSAGADPGPICYGRGGEQPTVTDAQVVLGRLDPALFDGPEDVGVKAASRAIEREIARPLSMDVTDAAAGIVDLANARMAQALRVVSVERGHDPRSFALVAFGGAGPLHAAALAADLDIPRVVCPASAGVLSALGLCLSDVLYDESVSRVRAWREVSADDIASVVADLEARGADRLDNAGVPGDRHVFERALELRYAGQSYELTVDLPDGDVDDAAMATVVERFHRRHEERYGHAAPEEPLELVTVRVRARGVVDAPDLTRTRETAGNLDGAERERRRVVFDGERQPTPVYEWGAVPTATAIHGPAIVAGEQSTALVPPDAGATVDRYGNLRLEVTHD